MRKAMNESDFHMHCSLQVVLIGIILTLVFYSFVAAQKRPQKPWHMMVDPEDDDEDEVRHAMWTAHTLARCLATQSPGDLLPQSCPVFCNFRVCCHSISTWVRSNGGPLIVPTWTVNAESRLSLGWPESCAAATTLCGTYKFCIGAG